LEEEAAIVGTLGKLENMFEQDLQKGRWMIPKTENTPCTWSDKQKENLV
jgi:hypothetical protein